MLSLASKARVHGVDSLTPYQRKVLNTIRRYAYRKKYYVSQQRYEAETVKNIWMYMGRAVCKMCGEYGYLSVHNKFNLNTASSSTRYIVTHNKYKDGKRVSTRCHLSD